MNLHWNEGSTGDEEAVTIAVVGGLALLAGCGTTPGERTTGGAATGALSGASVGALAGPVGAGIGEFGKEKTMSTVKGVGIPDSKLAHEITEFVQDTESPLLFHHSSRVFYWGALTGARRGLTFEPSCSMPAPCSTTWG